MDFSIVKSAGLPTWVWTAVALFLYAHVWFLVAIAKKRNDLADVAWGLGFLFLSLVQVLVTWPDFGPRSLIALGLVAAWALRLSFFIGLRSRGQPEDPRYQDMRRGWGKNWIIQTYFKVFILQSVLLYIVAQPALLALRLTDSSIFKLTTIDYFAQAVALFGLFIEAIADQQKSKFRADKNNKGKICDVGLWSKSRHPNYFGEITFWIGLSIFSLNDAPGALWIWVSPALLTVLLLKVSGVPLIEKRYKGRKDYADYKKRSNLLLPFRIVSGKSV